MLKWILVVCAAFIFSDAPAVAQWINQSQGGAFDDDPLHLGLTAKRGYGLGLRCKSDTSEIVYITPDQSFKDRAEYELANAVGSPKLRIRVDRGKIINIDARIVDVDGKATFVAPADKTLYETIKNSKQSISVIVNIFDKGFHETSFGARGSSAAMVRLLKNCAKFLD